MTVRSLITHLEAWANPAWQESWDNCGWQVQPGILDQAARVLVCLTPTLAVMQEAIASRTHGDGVNLIVAHHPLIFAPVKSLQPGNPVADMVALAYQHQIGIYTAHTNFDQVADGTADVLAQLLQLQDSQPIVPTPADGGRGGYGRVGTLPQALAASDLLGKIQALLHPPRLLHSPLADPDQPIARVAVLGGSGASFLDDVVNAGAQAYLTSDCKFHQFQEARDRGVILIDAGHYPTERPACARLTERLQELGASWAQLSQQDEDFRQFIAP